MEQVGSGGWCFGWAIALQKKVKRHGTWILLNKNGKVEVWLYKRTSDEPMKVYQSRCATLLHHSEHEIWYGGTIVRKAKKCLKLFWNSWAGAVQRGNCGKLLTAPYRCSHSLNFRGCPRARFPDWGGCLVTSCHLTYLQAFLQFLMGLQWKHIQPAPRNKFHLCILECRVNRMDDKSATAQAILYLQNLWRGRAALFIVLDGLSFLWCPGQLLSSLHRKVQCSLLILNASLWVNHNAVAVPENDDAKDNVANKHVISYPEKWAVISM